MSIRAIRAQGAGDLPGRTTVAVISPGSTARPGVLTSTEPCIVVIRDDAGRAHVGSRHVAPSRRR